jgi:hypothetical protein
MKFLLFSLIISLPTYALDIYNIKIPREVIEAMDLSDDLQRRLSGGDIIGNGGGIAEQDFRFAYRKIPGIVESCLESPFCPIPNKEVELLKNIKKLAKSNAENKDRLIFLSESDYPGFFRDSNDSQIRIAKTASINGAPIFINLDMLYDGKQTLLNFPAIISVLVHELGHQAKIKSHSLLDELGIRLREFLLEDSSSIEQQVLGHSLKVSYYNLKEANRFSEVMFHFKEDLFSLKNSLRNQVSCEGEESLPIGFKISNLHWLRRIEVSRGLFLVPLKAWLKVYCLDLGSSAIWVAENDVKVELLFMSEQGSPTLKSFKVHVGVTKLEDPSRPLLHQ